MPHSEVLPRQLGLARRLRSSMSEAEKKLWYHLRAHRFCGASFRRQAPIGHYVVDFVCHDARLIIELDGGQHAMANAAKLDQRRTAWLTARDYRVLRFWNSDVFSNMEGVLETVAIELQLNPPPGRSAADLPRKGGGEGQP
jgi:very-short-patch-repair endonuclease